LKQPQYHPLPFEAQVAVLFAAINGLLDEIAVEKIVDWEEAFQQYLLSSGVEVMKSLQSEKTITDEIEAGLKKLIEDFNQSFN